MRALAIVVQSGAVDRIHYALVLATAAAALDRPTTLFFTMAACRALVADGWRSLHASDGRRAEDYDAALAAAGIADMETLLASAAALGVRVQACETGLVAAGVEAAALRPDLAVEITGAVALLAEQADAQMLYV